MFWVCFRYSAGFQARMVLDSDAFRPGVLREVVDLLGVLWVDRVVPIVVRVLVSCWKQEWMKKKMCSRRTAGERTTKMRHVLIRWQTLSRRTKMLCNSWAKCVMCVPHFSTDCTALYVQCLWMCCLPSTSISWRSFFFQEIEITTIPQTMKVSHELQLICHCEVVRCEVEDEDAVSDNFCYSVTDSEYGCRVWDSVWVDVKVSMTALIIIK